jgi:hypothetical protein
VFYFYASCRQERSPCAHRIRFADADRFAREDGNLRETKIKNKIIVGLGGLKTKGSEN